MKIQKSLLPLICTIVILFFNRCTNVPTPPPTSGLCTFTIYQPNNYNCFVRHQGVGIPTTKIKLLINIVTKYVNPNNSGPDLIGYDDASITIDPSVTSFPLTLTAKAPNKNPWYCEVNIQGTQCSECANGYGDPTESMGNCPSYIVSTSPITYRAAQPRWQSTTRYGAYSSSVTTLVADRIPNLPNTCGCTVQ